MTSALNQLEELSVSSLNGRSFEFPVMPRLERVVIKFLESHFIIGMDSARLPRLRFCTIDYTFLEQASFPDSLKQLSLPFAHSCSERVMSNVAKLPNLEVFNIGRWNFPADSHLCFISTLTTLRLPGDHVNLASDSLRRMTNLTSIHIEGCISTAEDIETISSLRFLTYLHCGFSFSITAARLSPFRHITTSLKHLHVENIPANSLQHLARPSFTFLELCECPLITSLSPLAACVNLTALRADVPLSEQDAQVLSGLTKLEQRHVCVTSEACFTHICRLPRLKLLIADSHPKSARFVGPVALQALAGLAPTIEKLQLPYSFNEQATVEAVARLTKLEIVVLKDWLWKEQSMLLRRCLPRLCRCYALGETFDYFSLSDPSHHGPW